MNRNPFEILFDNVLAGYAYASQSSDSASVKEQTMDNVNHPKHYENGPFECIKLSSLLSFDWGNVIKYCYRWRDKNGVEDLKKALWYAKHAIDNNVPFLAMYLGPDGDIITARPIRLLGILEAENWADLEPFWNEIKWGCYKKAAKVLTEKINEIEKDGE